MAKQIYKLLYARSVVKDLKKVPKEEREKIIEKIQLLVSNPYLSGSVPLQGSSGLFRIRSGDYRIIYTVNNGELTILIIKIGHRKEVYRKV